MLTKTIYRTLGNLVSPGGARGKVQIFIFHRVLSEIDPLSMWEPDIERFDNLIRLISETYNVISLGEACDRLSQKSLPIRAACITFDDGYEDNYSNALPILQKYNVPATVFIATDFIDGGIMWNDVIIESIRNMSGILTINELDVENENCVTFKEKRSLLDRLIPKIKYMTPVQREDIVMQIADITGYQLKSLMMTSEQIVEMEEKGITIGAHTCSHPILRSIDEADAKKEIAHSKEILQGILKNNVNLFAYPNGRPGEDYSNRDVDIVKSLGFKAAVSTRKDIATSSSNVFELPRFTPWDLSVHKFMVRNLVMAMKA